MPHWVKIHEKRGSWGSIPHKGGDGGVSPIKGVMGEAPHNWICHSFLDKLLLKTKQQNY